MDVFTDRAFGGNPLAVVLDAEGLSAEQMLAITREFNYAETTFVLPPRDAAHDAEVRIFMAKSEIPFAGHPNVGTAFVLASRADRPPARMVFEEKVGLVQVEIVSKAGKVAGAELTAPQPLQRLAQVPVEQAAACLSLLPGDVSTERHPPHIVSVGMPFLIVELASREALKRASVNADAFARTFPRDGCHELYFYTRDVPAGESPCEVQARMYFPGPGGISEDPATGSATLAAAALFADLDSRDGELKMMFGQGFDMARPSLLSTRVRKSGGRIVSVHVSGGCVMMMEGTLSV